MVDDLHRLVSLRRPARRIATLSATATEIVLALGLGHHLVAAATNGLPPEFEAAARALSALPARPAALLARHPDLVLALPGTPGLAPLLNAHIPVLFLVPENLAGIRYDVLVVGKATGETARALAVDEKLMAAVLEVERAVRHLPRPSVFYELDPSIFTAGRGTLIDQLITLAGGRNVVDRYRSVPYPRVSPETVLRWNPDVVVLGDVPLVTPGSVVTRPGWLAMRAVRSHRVFANIAPALIQEPGPDIADALFLLARDLHPGLHLP